MKLGILAAAAAAVMIAAPMTANAIVVVNETGVAGEVEIRYPNNMRRQIDIPLRARSSMDIQASGCNEAKVCHVRIYAPVGMRHCQVAITNNAATVTLKGEATCEVK